MRNLMVGLTLLLIFYGVSRAEAQSGAGYELRNVAITAGGGNAIKGDELELSAISVGQTVAGSTTGDDYTLRLGLWEPQTVSPPTAVTLTQQTNRPILFPPIVLIIAGLTLLLIVVMRLRSTDEFGWSRGATE